ncbi:Signal transduction histidine kinase CheA [Desulfovibrio sp. DV]|uniref:chemotaxis protein CheA n=1 Tax=Desulfovibrio sp. DV TaxID=1844708 RepID=UPI00094BB336|nr:chemotaxis protein CheA [Desulfovibrio sp. DV]OLN28120.1 Signal transduction histidine kinase CheA [Desulfovibrio sp. DV]
MNPLLEQFLSESRESLQSIGEKLMQLEQGACDSGLINEVFRLVHTLKGNSGLFEFPEMTRALHAGEDVMDAVRNGTIPYSRALADNLLEVADFVGFLCDEIESKGSIAASHSADSARLAAALRGLLQSHADAEVVCTAMDHRPADNAASSESAATPGDAPATLGNVPEVIRMDAYRRAKGGESLAWITFSPQEECFFQGDDPFFTVRQSPEPLWGRIGHREPWPPLAELNAYRCILDFELLTVAQPEELAEHFRYVPDQVTIVAVDPLWLVLPQGDPNGGPVYEDFVADALGFLEAGDPTALRQAAQTMLELSNPVLWLSSALRWLLLLMESEPGNRAVLRRLIESLRQLTPPDWTSLEAPEETLSAAGELSEKGLQQPGDTPTRHRELSQQEAATLAALFEAQWEILSLDDEPSWQAGRLKAVAGVLVQCCNIDGDWPARGAIETALAQALSAGEALPLLSWLEARQSRQLINTIARQIPAQANATAAVLSESKSAQPEQPGVSASPNGSGPINGLSGFGRRAEDSSTGPIKVDQVKIDRLMNLIGEMVVSKNALPYLAQRAENQFGVRELAREIKAQYTVINRIVEEMQDAIMQVRMRPVSFVFQRFPRLVRDISHKLGKDVQLALEGEDTEADKNIIECLADPLIHIVRNSLDHGLETPDERRACGKAATGTLTIRATQEADQVLIDIIDDGKGIDPAIIKRKAYEKGVIDETTLERITDREAINLVFAAGFSTAEAVSDLSGRGVGMDVVRAAVEKVNGTILLESQVGKGTHIRIALPLSMAVAKVMIVESDRQVFGVPMEYVVETVRVPRDAIRAIKQNQAVVLRGQIVPLKALNTLLELPAEPQANADDELAVLVARVGSEVVGLVVDNFHETVDVIQKPLGGVLSGLNAYSGSALMGDGSVLMVLNLKEIL